MKIKIEEILYSLLFPTFVIGQAYFKLNILIIIVIALIKFRQKLFEMKFSKIELIFLIFLVYLIFNSIVISKFYFTFNGRFIFYLILIIFFLVTRFLIINQKINFNNILKIGFLTIMFVYFDSIIQFIFKKDIFGYNYNFHYKRYPGPFGDEWILGYFISFTSILFLSIFSYKRNKIISVILFYLYIFLSLYVCLKSGERMAFMTFFIQVIMVLIFINYKSLKKIITLASTILVFMGSIFLIDKDVNIKYSNLFKLVFQYEKDFKEGSSNILSEKEISTIEFNKISFLNTQTGAHYLTAIEIWKKYPIFGVGIKNFRSESKKEIYSKIQSQQKEHRSATHPHNLYLEVLTETGLVGLILILYLFITIIKKSFYFFKENKDNNLLIFLFFSVFLSKIFPIKADPSILSSNLGSLFWINFIFLLIQLERR